MYWLSAVHVWLVVMSALTRTSAARAGIAHSAASARMKPLLLTGPLLIDGSRCSADRVVRVVCDEHGSDTFSFRNATARRAVGNRCLTSFPHPSRRRDGRRAE